jgi:hypothetical protein
MASSGQHLSMNVASMQSIDQRALYNKLSMPKIKEVLISPNNSFVRKNILGKIAVINQEQQRRHSTVMGSDVHAADYAPSSQGTMQHQRSTVQREERIPKATAEFGVGQIDVNSSQEGISAGPASQANLPQSAMRSDHPTIPTA